MAGRPKKKVEEKVENPTKENIKKETKQTIEKVDLIEEEKDSIIIDENVNVESNVQEENIIETKETELEEIPELNDETVYVDLIKEEAKEIKEKQYKKITDLSYHAKKWYDYLKLQSMHPVTFLQKYPKHKFKQFVEELLDLEENSDAEKNI